MPSIGDQSIATRQRHMHNNEDVVSGPTVSTVLDAVRRKNRRKRWLDLHSEYFGPDLELADPLLYDRFVRRFQTPAEREAEGRQKGYGGVLEADLYRSEAKIDALQHPDPESTMTYRRDPSGEILAEDKDDVPQSKEEGLARWKWEMEIRFIGGGDGDFDYPAVDENDAYDDHVTEQREAEDRYFDDEEPKFVAGEEAASRTKSHELEGETGVQDF